MTLWDLIVAQAQAGQQGADPRNQAPGMGSTANAMPYPNPMRDARMAGLKQENEGVGAAMTMGALSGGLAGAQQYPLAALLALGMIPAMAYGGAGMDKRKRLQYQGN